MRKNESKPIFVSLGKMESSSLYSEARIEYLKQLSIWITPSLVEFFRTEFQSIKTREGGDEQRAMALFQQFCANVPKWNQDVVDTNASLILDNCRCDYVEELMTAVFIAHTKMLTAIRVNSRNKKLQITLPKLDHFLHRVFVECARSFWKSPYIFSDELSTIERQKNIILAESLCNESLSGAVRSLLPVKSILKDYLEEDTDEQPGAVVGKQITSGNLQSGGKINALSTSNVQEIDADSLLDLDIEEKETDIKVIETVSSNEKKTFNQPEQEVEVEDVEAEEVEVEEEVVPKRQERQEKQEPATSNAHKSASVIITKLDQPHIPATPQPSTHSVSDIETKQPLIKLDKICNDIDIETEHSVHFTPYDTVFDHNTQEISEIRYSPKISVEDKEPSTWGEDDVPRLVINSVDAGETIDADDLDIESELIADIEPPVTIRAPSPPPPRAPSPSPTQRAPSPSPAPTQRAPSPSPAQRAPSPAPTQRAPSPAPTQRTLSLSPSPTQRAPSPPKAPTPLPRAPSPLPKVSSQKEEQPVEDIDIPLDLSSDFTELN